jgi:hypothetical protein
VQPYGRVANLRKFWRKTVATAFSPTPRIRPRKNMRLAARKIAPTFCRQFAARLVGRVNVANGRFRRRTLNRLTLLTILHRTEWRSRRALSHMPRKCFN